MNEQHDKSQPLATRPELRAFVAAAREQQIVGTTLSAAQVQQAWQRRRNQRRRAIGAGAGVVLALAAAVTIAIASPRAHEPEILDTGVAEHEPELLDTGRKAHDPELLDTGVAAHDPELAAHDPGLKAQQRLASAIRVQSSSAVEVRGPWSIALGDGEHEVEVDATRDAHGDRGLAIFVSGDGNGERRALELLHGRASVEVHDGEMTAVRLHNGVAAWVEADGSRTQLSVERSEALQPKRPDANELARKAESLLADGRRDDAIAVLEQLVRRHPKASQSRTGLLDLARLLRVAGQRDRARCAYALYLERWPGSSLKGDVESQLAELGKGPTCAGLNPR